MTTNGHASEPTPTEVRLVERFRELERVTAAYWIHARLAGLQLVVLGAWLLASGAIQDAALSRAAVLASPLAWAAAACSSLALYPSVEPSGRARWTPVAFWGAGAALLAILSRATWYRPAAPRTLALAMAAAVLGALLLAVHALASRGVETGRGLLGMLAAADAIRDRFDDEVLWGAAGLVVLLVGGYRLIRFVWLGRRMRVLQRQLRMPSSDG